MNTILGFLSIALRNIQIKYNITKIWPNGVRVGNVPNHKNKLKGKDNMQSLFPKNWSAKDIKRAGEHVAGLKKIVKPKMVQLFMAFIKALE